MQVFLFKVVLPRTVTKGKKLPVYLKVEKQAIHCIYYQALFWMLLPYMPLAAFLMIFAYLSDFAFDRWFLFKFCAKQPAGTSSAAQLRVIAQYYLVTFTMFGMVYQGMWIVNGYMNIADVGPYNDMTEQSPYHELLSYSEAAASTINFIFSLPVVIAAIVVLITQQTMRGTRASFLQASVDIQAASYKFQVEAQGARLRKLKAENERLRTATDKLRRISQTELEALGDAHFGGGSSVDGDERR